ncbi:hypothetical protein [African swine fever virus]
MNLIKYNLFCLHIYMHIYV